MDLDSNLKFYDERKNVISSEEKEEDCPPQILPGAVRIADIDGGESEVDLEDSQAFSLVDASKDDRRGAEIRYPTLGHHPVVLWIKLTGHQAK